MRRTAAFLLAEDRLLSNEEKGLVEEEGRRKMIAAIEDEAVESLIAETQVGGREKRDRREDSCPLLEGYHVGRTRNKCRQGESPEGRRRRETWQAYGPGAEIERFHRLLSFVSLPSLSPLLFLALLLSDRQVVASHHGHLPRLGPHMVRPPSLPSLPLPPSSLSPAR
jgi:hypothetical protein